MKYDVELIVRKGDGAITTYTQWLSQPLNVDPAQEKMYVDGITSPNWNCAETQLLLDTIQAQGGLTVTLYDNLDVNLGTALLTTGSALTAGCGSTETATLSYNAMASSGDTIKTYYFTWEYGEPIEYNILELYDNETISQNWRFSDLQTFAALGSFSRQFRIPATRHNLQALGYLTDVNFKADTDYFQTKLPAELRVQTLPIAIGYVRVMRVITQADKLADFEVTFYAESPDLFNAIAGKKLKDIAALADLNAVLDYNAVISQTGDPVLYSLSDYGQKWNEQGVAGTRSIYDETVTGCMRAGDLTPSLNWQWIFSKIIEEAGFTYTGVDLDNALYRYYAPWINSKQLNYQVSTESALFAYYLNSNQALTSSFAPFSSVAEAYDNGNNVTGAIYTAPADGVYYFRFWYTAAISALSIIYVRGYNLTTNTPITLYTGPGVGSGTQHYDSGNSLFGIQLSAGDQFRIEYRVLSGGVATLQAGASYGSGTGLELYNVDTTDLATLDWSLNAPDVTQADFLRDVLNMHCCVIVPDRTTTSSVIFQPIKDYVGSGNDRDWSRKLDVSKDITLSNTSDFQTKRLTFTYSAGEDVGSKIYTGLNRIYGDYKIVDYTVSENDVPNDFAKDSEQKVQLVTQSTPTNYIAGTSIVIPKFVDSDGNFVSPKLRCLFHASDVEVTLWNSGGNFPDPAVVVPVLNHYENIVPFFTDLDLNWAPEVPLYIIGPSPYKTLFNEYWRDYLNQLYSPQARIMEAYFALELSDILNFKFSDRIWVKDAWWRILEINDYKVGSSEVTQVKLLKLIEAVPETSVTPSDVTSGGVVEFVDGNGDPAAATKSACNRYGYTWDETTNTCYALTTAPQKPTSVASTTKVGSSTREVSNALNTIVMTDKLNNDSSNVYTIAAGTDITLAVDNQKSIAVGEKTIMAGTGGVSMFGRNVYTKQSGQHLGGGYMNDTPATSPDGYAQSGVIMLQSKQTFAAAGGQFLFINGVNNLHIDMPDDTCWNCLLSYTIQDDNLTGNYESGVLSFAMIKSGGIAAVSALTPLNVIGGIGAHVFTFGVNVVTTSLHRIGYQVTGGTFPDTFHVTASLSYTQSKLS